MREDKANPKLQAIIGITVAIIGCIGAILAAIIGILPDFLAPEPLYTLVPQVQTPVDYPEESETSVALVNPTSPAPTNTSAPIPTKTFTPSPTPEPIQSTSTPTPMPSTFTPTPMPPTSTPTAEPQTSENHMKSLGEGYSLNGVSLTLEDYRVYSSDIGLWFVVKNESSGSMIIRYQNSHFELYDDTGRQYDHDVSCEYDTKQRQLEIGDAVTLRPANGGCDFDIIGEFDGVISQDASYLIVKVSKFMDLQDMQWRIDLMPPASTAQNPSPGEILLLKEGFSANGVSLTLEDYRVYSSDIGLWFVVKNESSGSMIIRYQNSHFELYDDT
ncbi:MAG: hypothetical protein GY843_20595, partial [Neptuniibacter sp.]|nr:hypothetical protein [Neptuniibacter sp.]